MKKYESTKNEMLRNQQHSRLLPTISLAKCSQIKIQTCYCSLEFPRCSREIVGRDFVTKDVLQTELEFYEYINEDFQTTHIVLLAWYGCWLSKGVYYVIYALIATINIRSIDNYEYAPNLRSQFRSLETNCTRLSPGKSLAEDFVDLSVFATCHPNLMRIYTPIISLHAIGLNIYSVVIYFIFLICIMFFRYYFRKPLQESSLFPVAPIYSAQTECRQIQLHI